MRDWKVLLVDDEEEFVSTLAERLALRGVEVRVANNGKEALQKIEDDPPRVVVLDLMMPGLSGLEVLARIKRDYPAIEVILLTGMARSNEAGEGMRQGAFAYLMKPLSIEKLMEKIGEAMKQHTGKVD
ncbi:MAG: response regulator [Thermodesulfobacteriota bacterium]